MNLYRTNDSSDSEYIITKEYFNNTGLIVTYTIQSYYGLKKDFDNELSKLVEKYLKIKNDE